MGYYFMNSGFEGGGQSKRFGILRVSLTLLGTSMSSRNLMYKYSSKNSTSKSAAPSSQCSSTASPLSHPLRSPPHPIPPTLSIHPNSSPPPPPNLPKLPTTAPPESASIVAFSGVEIGHLAKRGPFSCRQTKNAVRNAQTLDFNEKRLLAMHYMLKLLEEAFERGLKRILVAIGNYS